MCDDEDMMKLKRLSDGVYANDRVEIRKVVSRQTGRTDEVCWRVFVDGKAQIMHEDTLREARETAERLTR